MATKTQEKKKRLRVSGRVNAIEESLTLALTEKVAAFKAKGIDVVSFGAGEPDFDTPEHIKKAAVDALAKGYTKYTSSSGIMPLRKAVAAKLQRENGLSYDGKDVLISAGAKQAIFNALQATVETGDEVLIPAPYWVSYPEMVKTTGATPVAVPTREEDGFKLKPDQLAAAVTRRSKVFILCSPCNPTGIVYKESELRALAEVIVEHDLIVISDEIYEKLVYGTAKHVSIASFGPEIQSRTFVVNGFSKTFAMTGWRMGYSAGPSDLMAACAKIQSQSTSNANSIAQYASLAALEGDTSFIKGMVAEYQKRRDTIVSRLRALPGVSCIVPDGAFYAFPRVEGLFGKRHGSRKISDATALADALLDEAHISVVTGAGFGSPEHIRLSYATSMKNIVEGMDRFERFVKELK